MQLIDKVILSEYLSNHRFGYSIGGSFDIYTRNNKGEKILTYSDLPIQASDFLDISFLFNSSSTW